MYFLNIELLLELFKILTNNFLFKLYFYLVKFYLNLLLDKWWIANFKISKMRPLKFAFLKYQIPFPAFALITSLPKLLKWLLVLAQHNYSRGLTSYWESSHHFLPNHFLLNAVYSLYLLSNLLHFYFRQRGPWCLSASP